MAGKTQGNKPTLEQENLQLLRENNQLLSENIKLKSENIELFMKVHNLEERKFQFDRIDRIMSESALLRRAGDSGNWIGVNEALYGATPHKSVVPNDPFGDISKTKFQKYASENFGKYGVSATNVVDVSTKVPVGVDIKTKDGKQYRVDFNPLLDKLDMASRSEIGNILAKGYKDVANSPDGAELLKNTAEELKATNQHVVKWNSLQSPYDAADHKESEKITSALKRELGENIGSKKLDPVKMIKHEHKQMLDYSHLSPLRGLKSEVEDNGATPIRNALTDVTPYQLSPTASNSRVDAKNPQDNILDEVKKHAVNLSQEQQEAVVKMVLAGTQDTKQAERGPELG